MSNPVLDAIRSRRVARNLTGRPLERALLEQVLDAARWAPNAGNRRLQRFVAVEDPLTLRLLRMVSPGMFQRPTAAVLICIDRERVVSFGMHGSQGCPMTGTAAQTTVAAHCCPIRHRHPFSQAARAILNLPSGWSPELFVCLGHAEAAQPSGHAPGRLRPGKASLTGSASREAKAYRAGQHGVTGRPDPVARRAERPGIPTGRFHSTSFMRFGGPAPARGRAPCGASGGKRRLGIVLRELISRGSPPASALPGAAPCRCLRTRRPR